MPAMLRKKLCTISAMHQSIDCDCLNDKLNESASRLSGIAVLPAGREIGNYDLEGKE